MRIVLFQIEAFWKHGNSRWEYLLLCDKIISPDQQRNVKERAFESLIAASLQRKDNKHKQLDKCESLNIHKNCHGNYVKESKIKAAQKKAVTSKVCSRRGSISLRKFDFSKYCLFCGESLLSSTCFKQYSPK